MTADEIRQAEARYQRASRQATEARDERDAVIRQALAEHWTQRAIAEATGLSHGRIGQIALRRRETR